jgi:hypothetical protein
VAPGSRGWVLAIDLPNAWPMGVGAPSVALGYAEQSANRRDLEAARKATADAVRERITALEAEGTWRA